MAMRNDELCPSPLAITPARIDGTKSTQSTAKGDSHMSAMPYACKTCARRKVKCDKTRPKCSSCRKGKLECLYQAPQPRRQKIKLTDDVFERLDRYERILHEHGLLHHDASPATGRSSPQESISFHWDDPGGSRTGRLLTNQGKSRYIGSNIWRNLEDEVQSASDEEEDGATAGIEGGLIADPLTGVFLGYQERLTQYHPTHTAAMMLWGIHLENIEPLCKILHVPSTVKIVEKVSEQPNMASKSHECLLFAIYHFAVFSMTEEECNNQLGESRAALLKRYHFAARQALVNSSFLKTTEMSVLQALILFLIPCRFLYDSQTYWILTGVAVRIGQRMGLHRDGEKLGLSPFDVQMRRRLFYQLLPLDGNASQLSGTGMSIIAHSWDTEAPLNINDNQIWPGMTETPIEQKGATEMIFCLSRLCVGKFFAQTGQSGKSAGSWQINGHREAELIIAQAEKEVEEKYIRYCDIVNPLHFLVVGLARCGVAAMRLRLYLPKARNKTATDEEMKELFQLTQKIMDTDTAVHAHTASKKYRWYVKPFFLWGTWDSLIFILTTLWTRCDLLSPSETDDIWSRVEQLYKNHDQLLESRRALYVAFGRLTLKAWDANMPSGIMTEPSFITALRILHTMAPRGEKTEKEHRANVLSRVDPLIEENPTDANPWAGQGIEIDGLDLDTDWMFWDQLIQAHQVEGYFDREF